nr:unnamed protein product [Callosobruchus chinensis]
MIMIRLKAVKALLL